MPFIIGSIVAILVMYALLSVFTSSYFGLIKTKTTKQSSIRFARLMPNLIIPIILSSVLLFIFFEWWVSMFVLAGVIALIGVIWSIYEKGNRIGPLMVIMLGLSVALAAGTTLAIIHFPAQLSYILMVLGAIIISISIFVFMLSPDQKTMSWLVLIAGISTTIAGLILVLAPFFPWPLLLLIVFALSLLVNTLLPFFTKKIGTTHYYSLTFFMLGLISMVALTMNLYNIEMWIILLACIALALIYLILLLVFTKSNVYNLNKNDKKITDKRKKNRSKVIDKAHNKSEDTTVIEDALIEQHSSKSSATVSPVITNLVMVAISIAIGIYLYSLGYVMIAFTSVLLMMYLTFNINSLLAKKQQVSRYWLSSVIAIVLTILLNYAVKDYAPFTDLFYRILLTSGFYFIHILFIHIIYYVSKYNLLNKPLKKAFISDEASGIRFVKNLRILRDLLFPAALSTFVIRLSFALYPLLGNGALATLIAAFTFFIYALVEIIYHRTKRHMIKTTLYSLLLCASLIMMVVTLFILGLQYWVPWATLLIGIFVSVGLFIGMLLFLIRMTNPSRYL